MYILNKNIQKDKEFKIEKHDRTIFPGEIGLISIKKKINFLLDDYFVSWTEEDLDSENSYCLLDIFFALELDVPVFCYHEMLSTSGNCRMCIVEVTTLKVLNVACCLLILPEMVAFVDSIAIIRARESVLEFLLINHPLDCPICDQGGECDLQDLSFIFGRDIGRFTFHKRFVHDFEISPLIYTIMTRCIHCTRCIRFFDEIVHLPILGTFGRGFEMIIGTYFSFFIDGFSNLISNVIDVCPVGALTSRMYSFIARPWELETIPSVLYYYNSFGYNVNIDICSNRIYRILPRLNIERNDLFSEFLPDNIRYGFSIFFKNRIFFPLICFNLKKLKLNFLEKINKIYFFKKIYYNVSWIFSFFYFSTSFFFFLQNYCIIGYFNYCSISSLSFFYFFFKFFGNNFINFFNNDSRNFINLNV